MRVLSEFSVIVPPSATVPPPVSPVPAVTVTEECERWALSIAVPCQVPEPTVPRPVIEGLRTLLASVVPVSVPAAAATVMFVDPLNATPLIVRRGESVPALPFVLWLSVGTSPVAIVFHAGAALELCVMILFVAVAFTASAFTAPVPLPYSGPFEASVVSPVPPESTWTGFGKVKDDPETVFHNAPWPFVARNIPESPVCTGARLLKASESVVSPVPPLATASVPPSVSVPDVVMAPPVSVRPVVPPEPVMEVTVPVPPTDKNPQPPAGLS